MVITMDLMEIDDSIYMKRNLTMEGLVTKVDFQRRNPPSRCVSVGLGLLCAVLLAGNVGQFLYYHIFSHTISADLIQAGYNTGADQLQGTSNASAAERKLFEATLSNLTKEKDQLQTIYDDMQKNYDELRRGKDELQRSYNSLKNDKDQLQTSYTNLTRSKNLLQNRYQSQSTDKEALQGRYNTLQREKEQLQTNYGNLATVNDQLQKSMGKVQGDLTKEKDRLQQSLNTLTQEKNQLQTNYNDMQNNRDNLQREKNDLQTSFNMMRINRDELQRSYNSLKSDKDQLQTSYTNLSQTKNLLQNRYQSLSTDKEALQGRYNTLQREKEQLQTNYSSLSTIKDQLEKKINELYGSCQTGWTKFGGNCYYVTVEKRNWASSRDYCINLGADLAIINSRSEQLFVNGLLGSGVEAWIGLTDSFKEGTWQWVDGTPVTTTYWEAGQPNSYSGNQDCAELMQRSQVGEWNDEGCSYANVCVCEKMISDN